jgi:hypothetical protein
MKEGGAKFAEPSGHLSYALGFESRQYSLLVSSELFEIILPGMGSGR